MTEDELKQALEKFDDSKEIAEQSMFNLLECDVSPPHPPRTRHANVASAPELKLTSAGSR